MTALRGSCLCGGVRFEIDGPLMRSSDCHCRQCQKAHGAPFRTRAQVAAAYFRFLAGEELVSFYESTSRWGVVNAPAKHLIDALRSRRTWVIERVGKSTVTGREARTPFSRPDAPSPLHANCRLPSCPPVFRDCSANRK